MGHADGHGSGDLPVTALRSRARKVARRFALEGLAAVDARTGRQGRSLQLERISFPYFHSVAPAEEARFRAWIEALLVEHTFVSYTEAVSRLLHGPIDRPLVALSFDDGFASNARTARVLADYGISACFFVPTGFIGTTTLAEAHDFFGFTEGVDEPAMTWADLEQMKAWGHEIGNHTVGHRVISWVSESEAVDEIGTAAETLRERLGESRHFAWPRGQFAHFTEAGARAVFATGHESCSSAVRGAHAVVHRGPTEALCIRRDHAMAHWPQRHLDYFLARSAARATATSNEWPPGWRVPA
jgi:peptidoglycan/xylan/chitin deacetylase (PgdA/CDA1 family)